jgi:multidrug efflux pump subunit AcrA (membrane-fusion protein)
MGDVGAPAEAPERDDPEGAFGTARALLDGAEADARSTRADADRYVRLREQEAEMLVAKARRVLLAAEQKAAVIIATARAQVADGTLDLTQSVADEEISRVIAPGASRLYLGGHPTRLDRMLAAAITHAVDESFPIEVIEATA